MTESFDPYLEWLRIPADEQPTNHYRLLGIPLFESDQRVIAEASLDVATILRRYQLSERAAISRRLLGEVARAKTCLLDPERKRAYDAELKQQLDPTPVDATPTVNSVKSPTAKVSPWSNNFERWCRLQFLKLRRKHFFLPQLHDALGGHSFMTAHFGAGILAGMVLTVILLYATSIATVTAIAVIIVMSGLLGFNRKANDHK